MSIVPVTSGAGAAIAAAAAAKQRKEEEQMTTYNRDDLDGWEFKIMRSTFGRFNSHQAIEKVRAVERQTGWELVEKFDEYRLRFKRRVERRTNDHLATVDPYRTSTGSRIGAYTGIILALVLLVGIAVVLFLSS